MSTLHTIKMIQCTCLLLSLCLFTRSLSAVLGIDFGSDLVKVAAVVPGRSFDIVLDGASKRSHPNLVVFDDDVRQYGTEASSLVSRRPQRSFMQFSRLLGKPHNTSMIQELQSFFLFNPVLPDEKRHTVRFESPYYDPSQATVDVDPEQEPSPENAANILNIIASEPSISVEEIATMKLKHIKRMAEKETDAEVKDCVIAVPEFWSYKERQALLDASQMAGLNVLGLINENTAAALQYALSRDYAENKTEVVVFYNMGATSTKVSVVKYFQDMTTSKKSSKSKKTNPGKGAFEVVSQAWDETLGAQNFDIALANTIMKRAFETLAQRKHINADFTSKVFQDELRKDPRFTARIRTAASRAKKILSANTETLISIEGVYEDEDFKTTVTRDDLYESSQDVFERALATLTKAVQTSGYDKADLESIVLVGGGTRIPQIRTILTDFIEKPLKEDLNADEAPAFGAAFRAANLSSTFRVRSVGMDDITAFAVGVRLKDLRPPEGDEKAFKKRGSLFNENNHLFRRRAVTLKHGKDLRVDLFYEKSAALPMDTSRDLGYYEVSGISKAVEKYMNNDKYNITELPKVTLSFLLDANGIVDLVSATASFTEWVTEEKEIKSSKKKKDKTKTKTKGKDSDSDDVEDDDDNENGDKSDSENDENTDDDSKESEEETKDENEAEKKGETEVVQRKRTHRVDLNAVRNRPEDVQAMEQSDFAHSAKILLELDERDRSVRETADARNELESYIFESRNRLSDEANVEKVSTAEERESFMEQLSAAEDWIWEIEKETASIFKTKIRELKQVGNAIFSRADEITARPTAINAAGKTLSQLYESVELLRTNYSWVNATEIEKLENMTKKAETWLNKKVEEQDEKSLLEKPAFMSYEVYYKVEPIVEFAKKLLSRPKPYGWGKKKKSKNATNETSSSGDGDGEEQSGDGEGEGDEDGDFTAKIEVDADGDTVEEDEEDGEQEDADGDDVGDVDDNDNDDDDETTKEDL